MSPGRLGLGTRTGDSEQQSACSCPVPSGSRPPQVRPVSLNVRPLSSKLNVQSHLDQPATLDAAHPAVGRSQLRDAAQDRGGVGEVVEIDSRFDGLRRRPSSVFLTLTSRDLTAGRRVVPRGSTVSICVPCVRATVLFPTETVVVSGNP